MLPNLMMSSALALVPMPAKVLECRALVLPSAQMSLQTPAIWKDSSSLAALQKLLREKGIQTKKKSAQTFALEILHNPKIQGEEAYELEIKPGLIRISASADAGAFYAVQTLAQALNSKDQWPCVSIQDRPRFAWRGLHLDVARHYRDSADLVRIFDFMSEQKLNVFHLHLTDDQGWRMEIPAYPLLTQVGAYRVDRSKEDWNQREPAQPGEKATYGGYYSTAQLRGLVREAGKRHIQIVPEIEIPAHASAALAAYPELSCSGIPTTVPPGQFWPVNRLFCPSQPQTMPFLGAVLRQVADVFPSPWVHLGGDEADFAAWENSPETQLFRQKLGLKNSSELQAWMLSALADTLSKKGKKTIAWDEVLSAPNLPRNMAVMAWHGPEQTRQSLDRAAPTLIAWQDQLYLDHAQAAAADEPRNFGGMTTLQDLYQMKIDPQFAQDPRLLGIQGQLWSEYLPQRKDLDYMLFPRIGALAERAWSTEGDLSQDSYIDFLRRLAPQEESWQARGVQFERQGLLPSLKTRLIAPGQLEMSFASPLPELELRCLIDQNADWNKAFACNQPWIYYGRGKVGAAVFQGNQRVGKALWMDLRAHQALGMEAQITPKGADKYNGSTPSVLVDGRLGSNNYGDGQFWAQEGSDLEMSFNFPRGSKLSQMSLGMLQDAASWIFVPQKVELIGVNSQGEKVLASWQKPNQISEKTLLRPELHWTGEWTQFRLKILAQKNCPPGHVGAGGKAWTFLDEIEFLP